MQGFWVDLYLRPHPPKGAHLVATWRAMETCQQLGFSRAIGVSNFSSFKLATLLRSAHTIPAVNQICCSISDTGGKGHTARMDRPKRTRQQIQDMINADLARRYPSDDEDIEGVDPLYVEEDDPNWLDEPDEGWGYKVSDLFKEDFGVKNRKNYNKDDDDDDVNNIPDMDWDFQPETFSAVDVDSASWTATVFGDPTPLVALIYERYGRRGRECYHVLRELEDAANRMWEAKRLPPRLIKINASFEEDLVSAIGIKEIPTFLFLKGGKLIHYQSGYLTADDLLKIISYFYHGAARPKCLKIPPKGKASVKL